MEDDIVAKVGTSKEANERNENPLPLQNKVTADYNTFTVEFENRSLENLENDKSSEYCYDTQKHTIQLEQDAWDNNIVYCSTCGEVIHVEQVKTEIKQNEQFQCNECGKLFLSEVRLKQHIYNHKQKKIFECGECEKIFTNPRVLEKHFNLNHVETQTHFVCNTCGINFESLPLLNAHKSVHRDKNYTCLICEKMFSVSTSLKQHILVHAGERKYQCNLCHKKFIRKCNLKQHLLVHTNHKTFQCFRCGMTFKHKGQLKRHTMTHTGEKAFFCDQCGKAFADYRNMKRHQTTHLQEKPFKCSICYNRFKFNRNLKRHIRMLHQKADILPSA